MKIQNYQDVKSVEAAPGAFMHVMAGPDEGAPSFVMRLFEIEPGGGTPHHNHAWEHELFVVDGTGVLKSGNTERPIAEGDAIMVLPDEQHGILNTSKDLLRVICVVPLVDGKMPGMKPGD
ncbi:MAG: cupin domain-containing protein [Dehalococcoidia bacterium]|jgi:quercetin dioxygenase-like cupin family protein